LTFNAPAPTVPRQETQMKKLLQLSFDFQIKSNQICFSQIKSNQISDKPTHRQIKSNQIKRFDLI
jgi:hypothetical protein